MDYHCIEYNQDYLQTPVKLIYCPIIVLFIDIDIDIDINLDFTLTLTLLWPWSYDETIVRHCDAFGLAIEDKDPHTFIISTH